MDHQNNEKLVSEKDGSDLAGVSPDTLRQYRAIGILKGQEKDGAVFYSRDELASVFFLRPQKGAVGAVAAAAPAPANGSPDPLKVMGTGAISRSDGSQTEGGQGFTTAAVPIGNRPEPTEALPVMEEPAGSEPAPKQPSGRSNLETAQDQTAGSRNPQGGIGQNGEAEPRNDSFESAFDATDFILKAENHGFSSHFAPNQRAAAGEQFAGEKLDAPFYPLQNVAASRYPSKIDHEALQLNRTLREQVEMLKEERDWLRSRLEKLEVRYEREQMILLSENDTVRTLIHQIGKPKRRWWHALPWFQHEDQKR